MGGILSNEWWTVDDANLLAVQPTCTGVAVSESFQGAINFAGLGKALPSEEDLPLDCFEGKTSVTFLEELDQHLTDGYPTAGDNETQVARPHMELRAHAADGVCGWVNFTGNDKPGVVSMKQVRGSELVTIGMAFPNGSLAMGMNGGLSNDSWTAAKEDAKESFPWLVFKVLTPLLCVCCPAIAGCIRQS